LATKPNEISPIKINKSKDLNGWRKLEIKETFVFIRFFLVALLPGFR
jgi:hypothetical protein